MCKTRTLSLRFKQLLTGFLLTLLSSMSLAQVGLQQLNVGELKVTMVYPTEEQARPISIGAFQLSVAADAKPKAGNHRLIVLSHGAGGSTLTDHELAKTLAQSGFIVAQPLHTGDNWQDHSQAGPNSWETRPVEISKVIDFLSTNPVWGPLFDPQKVGVHGMSAGGATALTLAGGQWSMLTLIQHCAKHLEQDIGFCLYGMQGDLAAQTKRRALLAKSMSAPAQYLPANLTKIHAVAQDDRIQAVTVAAPVVAIFTPDSLAKLRIPVGVITATHDELLLPQFHSNYLLENCTNCTRLVDIQGAGHFDLLAPLPSHIAQSISTQQMRGGYPNPSFNPINRTQAFEQITAYFKKQLKTSPL